MQESGTDNLAVVIGQDNGTGPALAGASPTAAQANLFNQLREEFEFVVVNSSPVLTVADARFVSRHVDTVVLSVLRDVGKGLQIPGRLRSPGGLRRAQRRGRGHRQQRHRVPGKRTA